MKKTLLAAILALAVPLSAGATSIGSSSFINGGLGASAAFDLTGNILTVTLTNTGSGDVMVPSDILTALFFSTNVGATLTVGSAVLNTGSTVFYDAQGQPAGGVVGGEWAYKSGLSGAPLGANSGISSTGVGLFGAGDLFPGPDLEPPASPDGPQYGILSAGDNTATGNSGVLDSGGLIKNSVVFTLTVVGNLTSISNISFQYGTSLTEPNFSGGPGDITVPDGGMTLSLLGLALGSLGMFARRRA